MNKLRSRLEFTLKPSRKSARHTTSEMRPKRRKPYLYGLLVGGLVLSGSAFLEASQPQSVSGFEAEVRPVQSPPLAVVTWSDDEITFAPLEAGVQVHLRVTGPDYVYEESSEGEGLFFQALEDDGGSLPDGVYRYELVETPQLDRVQKAALAAELEPEAERALKRQWRRQGMWPPPRPRVQQAVFHIEGGHIVAPD